MRDGVAKVEMLGQRMEAVRERVKEQERKEGEWVERVRRRVRWCWGVAGGLLLLCVVVGVLRHWPRVERGLEVGEQVVERFANKTIEGLEGEVVGEVVGEAGRDAMGTSTMRRSNGIGGSSQIEPGGTRRGKETDHPVLRMLDEL